MVPFQEELNNAKKRVDENLNKCQSLIFFGIKNGNEVIGVTAGNDRDHANLLISAAMRDEGFARFLIKVGAELEKMKIGQISKN